jgi:hypothetical protein
VVSGPTTQNTPGYARARVSEPQKLPRNQFSLLKV